MAGLANAQAWGFNHLHDLQLKAGVKDSSGFGVVDVNCRFRLDNLSLCLFKLGRHITMIGSVTPIDPAWLVEKIRGGVTSGASAPAVLVKQSVKEMRRKKCANTAISERECLFFIAKRVEYPSDRSECMLSQCLIYVAWHQLTYKESAKATWGDRVVFFT